MIPTRSDDENLKIEIKEHHITYNDHLIDIKDDVAVQIEQSSKLLESTIDQSNKLLESKIDNINTLLSNSCSNTSNVTSDMQCPASPRKSVPDINPYQPLDPRYDQCGRNKPNVPNVTPMSFDSTNNVSCNKDNTKSTKNIANNKINKSYFHSSTFL